MDVANPKSQFKGGLDLKFKDVNRILKRKPHQQISYSSAILLDDKTIDEIDIILGVQKFGRKEEQMDEDENPPIKVMGPGVEAEEVDELVIGNEESSSEEKLKFESESSDEESEEELKLEFEKSDEESELKLEFEKSEDEDEKILGSKESSKSARKAVKNLDLLLEKLQTIEKNLK